MRATRGIQWVRAAGLSVILALLAACGGGGKPAAPAAAPQAAPAPQASQAPAPAPAAKPIPLKVGILSILNTTPIWTADKMGYFKEQGLDVQLQTFQGGAVALPAMLNGQVDITYSNYPSVVQLVQQGGKVQVVAGGAASLNRTPEAGGVLVGPDSKLKSIKDLAGATIGLNTLKSVEQLSIMRMLEKNGVDPRSVKFVEVPWANQADVYKQGTIQALGSIEPFHTRFVKQAGFHALAYFYPEAWPKGLPLAGWVARSDWAAANKDAVQRFAKALDKAVQYLKQNPAEERKLMAEFNKLDPALADTINVQDYSVKVDAEAAQIMLDGMVDAGFMKQKIKFADLLFDTAK